MCSKFGTRIRIIDAGYGAGDCNGYTGKVVEKIKGGVKSHGLPENEPHIKVLLDNGVYQKKEKEYWRINTQENGLKYEIY